MQPTGTRGVKHLPVEVSDNSHNTGVPVAHGGNTAAFPPLEISISQKKKKKIEKKKIHPRDVKQYIREGQKKRCAVWSAISTTLLPIV